jgi:uncharacterized protein YcaQ
MEAGSDVTMALTVTKKQARLFILAHQGLLTHRRFEGKSGIMAYVERAGSLQFDPLNVVGYNQELVLQSRIPDFRPHQLQELLYEDRMLIDGWDKNMSIFRREDWPCFSRTRAAARHKLQAMADVQSIVPQVIAKITDKGPLSSGDLEYKQVVDWPWAPTRLSRAVLESMYFAGDLAIHHKDRTRKVYDLTSRLLPAAYLQAPDPNPTDDAYWEWYVQRRIGAVGMLWNKSGDAWLGISGMRSAERSGAFLRLQEKGQVIELQVADIAQSLYIRAEEAPLLAEVMRDDYDYPERAFVLAPLDNMLWDRRLIRELFHFDYRWEVYKPAAEREYGYYVLPVMYGDRFIGRFEPGRDKLKRELIIKNWWWEPDVAMTAQLYEQLQHCFREFAQFTGAQSVCMERPPGGAELPELGWLADLSVVSGKTVDRCEH